MTMKTARSVATVSMMQLPTLAWAAQNLGITTKRENK